MVALLSVLILPLPTLLLDLGLALSITASVLVLMVALFLNRPLDFSSFPTLLLLTTLLRLSLNVAVTRLILSHGNEGPLAAGHVVAAFGGFLMGGDVVIGLIVFSILLVAIPAFQQDDGGVTGEFGCRSGDGVVPGNSYGRVPEREHFLAKGWSDHLPGAWTWIAEHPEHRVRLDHTLVDHALSAWKDEHITDGEFGRLLRMIDDGIIKAPSYLLVDDHDQISRRPVWEATHLLTGLVKDRDHRGHHDRRQILQSEVGRR